MVIPSLPETLFHRDLEELKTEDGFKELLHVVKDDMFFVKGIIAKHFEYFQPFVRGGKLESISNILSEIIDHVSSLQALNVKCCRYDRECKRKECCAYIHCLDFEQIIKPLKFLHEYTARFMESNHFTYSAAMIRNIYFIHTAIWNSFSRRMFGKKFILGIIKQPT